MDDTGISVQAIRAVIDVFIQTRLQAKLDKLKPEQQAEREKLQEAHQREIWLADAARRVAQIQQVTHAIKYTHPDAKGSSVYSTGNKQAGELLVGTHTLDGQLKADVVGNAAALDVYKFLKETVGDAHISLLELVLANHPQMRAAMSDNAELAQEWMQAFATLPKAKGSLASHTLTKQLYWPLGNNEYHLLAPLFSTSLISSVADTMRTHRFSDEAVTAREARKNKQFSAIGCHEYPDVVVQKYGGTKPQNISQLNSERYGENHLLPSLPPQWSASEIRPPLNSKSIFDGQFSRRKAVRRAVKDLSDYLKGVEDYNSMDVRKGSKRRVQNIIDEFLQYSAEIQQLPAGWSALPECYLPQEERLWLDPERALEDENFAADYRWRDWPDNLAKGFANWLNNRLSSGRYKLPVGEDEAFEWRRLLRREINMLQGVDI